MWPYLPELIERPVPRYTSYPTAPHFEAEVDGDRLVLNTGSEILVIDTEDEGGMGYHQDIVLMVGGPLGFFSETLAAALREEILAVIAKHVEIDRDKVQIKMDRDEDVSILEIDVEIPRNAQRLAA